MNHMDKKSRWFIFLFFASFICYALFTVLFGSQAPLMMQYYRITASDQGFITTMLSVGGITTALACTLYGERFPKLRTLGAGLILLAAMTLVIGFAPPYAAVIICALFAGIAYTLIDVMVNSSITQYFSDRSKTILPMAHMFFGVGAMAGPYLMTAIVNPQIASSFTTPFLFVGGLTAVVFILFSVTSGKFPGALYKNIPPQTDSKPADVFKSKKFWLLLLGGVLYCCFTTGILSWYTTYFNTTRGYPLDTSGLMLTLFFAGSLAMRFFGPLIFSKIKPQKIFIYFSLLSIACMAIALSSGNFPLTVVFTVLSGAFQALNMPAIIFIGCALFPSRHASATSIAIFAYNVGGMVAPFMLGLLAKQTGFQIPMYLTCALFALGVLVMAIVSVKYKKDLQNA
ncbi:MAG: MFS transporter [Eubacteriales bacterium]